MTSEEPLPPSSATSRKNTTVWRANNKNLAVDLQSGVRPSTPNMVMYDSDHDATAEAAAKVAPKSSGAPPPVSYHSPPDSMAVDPVGGGKQPIWTVENGQSLHGPDSEDGDQDGDGDEHDDTKILLDKEFEDFYEDQVHKSAGPVVFVSKTLGMLPVIWTEDENESECKSYFNLYTFVLFIAWIGLAVISGFRSEKVVAWPAEVSAAAGNHTDPMRFISQCTADTYIACTWTAALVALIFGVFKCRSFAEILFGISEADGQLELREKHYEKIKRKALYWIAFLVILFFLHGFAFYTVLWDSNIFDLVFFLTDVLAHALLFALDLQFLYFCMILCKRYRLVNKILLHITKPWKTFRNDQPPNIVLQNILQYRFDQFFDPGADTQMLKTVLRDGQQVPLDMLIKTSDEPKVSKEEENTFIMQLDILRAIHGDLCTLAKEVDHLMGFQILVHLISSVIFVVMFGYFFASSAMDGNFYWPYLVLCLLPALRILLIGHWGQVMACQSRNPFMTICQVSTIDGSPRLERQVQKLTIQMHHQCPTLTAAGFFTIGRNMILKTIGCAVVFTFFMVKFQQDMDMTDGMKRASDAAAGAAAGAAAAATG